MNATDGAVLEAKPRQLDRALLASFLENVPEYVYFKDRQSRFVAASRSLARYHGCTSAAEMTGRTDFDFFHKCHALSAFDDEQRILRTGEPMFGKLERAMWHDGRETWVVTSKMPLRDEAGRIAGTFGISRDVTKTRELEAALEKAQKEVVEASRMAGMAEVATGVLHNVGNVLNSLNVSTSVITTGLHQSKADSLAKLGALLREHQSDLGTFLSSDPKGRRVPEFLGALAHHAFEEREQLLQEIAALQKNIDHIKEIVSMQQAYATMVGVVEPLDPAALMEDALRMNADALARHEVQVMREFDFVPPVLGERAKILQILVNLIRNAKHACDEGAASEKVVTLRIAAEGGQVRMMVEDNGVGVPTENLTRIFVHGFTTRAQGHGFGLHSSANAAREMKGSLTVSSAGRGRGATFTLQLPAAPASVPTA